MIHNPLKNRVDAILVVYRKWRAQNGGFWGTAIANNWTAINKNILVEEREFMRMERKLKKIGPQGGRGM